MFHGDELRDTRGRYFVSRKSCIATCYNIDTVQSTSLVLPCMVPARIVCGPSGVFIFGERDKTQEIIGGGYSPSCPGPAGYTALLDVWILRNPLSIEHVYAPTSSPSRLSSVLLYEQQQTGTYSTLLVTLGNEGHVRLASLTAVKSFLVWHWISGPAAIDLPKSSFRLPLAINQSRPLPIEVAVADDPSLGCAAVFLHDIPSCATHVLRYSFKNSLLEKIATVRLLNAPLRFDIFPEGFPQPVCLVNYPGPDMISLFSAAQVAKYGLEPIATMKVAGLDESCRVTMFATQSTNTLHVIPDGVEEYFFPVPNVRCVLFPLVEHCLSTISLAAVDMSDFLADLVRLMWANSNSTQETSIWGSLSALLLKIYAGGKPVSSAATQSTAPVKDANQALLELDCFDPTLLTAMDLTARTPSTESYNGSAVSTVTVSWSPELKATILVMLHLLHESCKMQRSHWNHMQQLGQLLYKLCSAVGWQKYVSYYAMTLCIPESDESPTSPTSASRIVFGDILTDGVLQRHFSNVDGAFMKGWPPDIFAALRCALESSGACSGSSVMSTQWPTARNARPDHPIGVANRVVSLFATSFSPSVPPITQISLFPDEQQEAAANWLDFVEGVKQNRMTFPFACEQLCKGVSQCFQQALSVARDQPRAGWDNDQLAAIGRFDKIQTISNEVKPLNRLKDILRKTEELAVGKVYAATLSDDDGVMMDPSYLKQWGDARLDIVQSMLNTATPIALANRGESSDVCMNLLKTLTRRALAASVGRGMLTMSTQNFRVRDSIPMPSINLNGVSSDGINITNDPALTAQENLLWPSFHNGCAAGLRFLPQASLGKSNVTRHWIGYQSRGVSNQAARAGLILATGITGHMKSVQATDMYSLLVSGDSVAARNSVDREPVMIAVMLGLSCSFRGTHKDTVFRCLSMHVQSLTPTTEDIEMSLEVQTAALVSIGILCQEKRIGFLSEMLVGEISRLPSDEHFKGRHGYALGAGISLGLILLGKGRNHGVSNIEDRLINLLNGGRRDLVPPTFDGLEQFDSLIIDEGHFLTRQLLKESSKAVETVCNRIFEGENFNVAVTGPAATVALGLTYLGTNDKLMAKAIKPEDTLGSMTSVSPDAVLLRTALSALVVWDAVEPSKEWIYKFVPQCLLKLGKSTDELPFGLAPAQVRYLLMNLGFAIGGAVLAVGLRFAGSMNADAKTAILNELKGFQMGQLGSSGISMTPVQRTTNAFENVISTCAIALSMVMAGTGDSSCLSILRKLYKRQTVSYGIHMSISMAIGLLFLGGGKMTLSNSTHSVAALLIAFYPQWPKNPTDNSVHLQALRHLYVLAVVPRAMEAIDFDTNQPVSVNVRIVMKSGTVSVDERSRAKDSLWTPMPKGREQLAVSVTTPCLLPDPSTIEYMEIRSPAHYHLSIRGDAVQSTGILVQVLRRSNRSIERDASDEQLIYVDWAKRLVDRSTPPHIARLILDNLTLLFLLYERFFFSSTQLQVTPLLYVGFVMALRRTINSRFSVIFQLGRTNQAAKHPLRYIFLDVVPVYDVCRGIVAQSDRIDSTAMGGIADEFGTDVSGLSAWMHLALHHYGLDKPQQLSLMLSPFAQALQSRKQRRSFLVRLNSKLKIDPTVLELLVACCFDFVPE